MNITQALAEFPEHADRMDKATRRVRWILRAQLAIWLGGGVITTANTAVMIEQDAPWWAITLGVLISVPLWVGASNMRPRFERLRELRAEWAHVRDIVEDADFQQFAKIFTGETPTTVTVDDDPTPAEPDPARTATPRGTTPA